MKKSNVCFVAMPFRPELNFFYLYVRGYLAERHGLRVERGDAQVLTKALLIHNVFVGRYRDLYDTALDLLRRFNADVGSAYAAASPEDFHVRMMHSEQTEDLPLAGEPDLFAKFLLPKIILAVRDVVTMQKIMDWITTIDR